jgi:hypothetical protein
MGHRGGRQQGNCFASRNGRDGGLIRRSPSRATRSNHYENCLLREQSKGRSFAQFQRQYAREAEFLRSKNRCGTVFA